MRRGWRKRVEVVRGDGGGSNERVEVVRGGGGEGRGWREGWSW